MASPVLSQLASSDVADWNSIRGLHPAHSSPSAAVLAVPRTDTDTRNPHPHPHLHPHPHRITRSPARLRRRSPPTLRRRGALACSLSPPPWLHPPPTSLLPKLNPNPNQNPNLGRWTKRGGNEAGRWEEAEEGQEKRRDVVEDEQDAAHDGGTAPHGESKKWKKKRKED